MIIPRIVLDTNVCLDLFVFHDPGCNKLREILRAGVVTAITNEACRSEWLRVLDYARLALDAQSREARLIEFDALVHGIGPLPAATFSLPSCEDADDQKFLELARDAQAAHLLTKDKALLKLNRKISKTGMFSILTPEAFSSLAHFKHMNEACFHQADCFNSI